MERTEMDSLWQRVDDLFHAALEHPEGEREAWLAVQAGADPAAAEEVRSLLAADRRHGELSAAAADELPAAGQRFGPYRTERLLGRGGMGAVYLARRDDGEFDQTVALKVMAPHAGEQFVSSFRNERQLLAALAHPHIARLLDGGVAGGGDPYLVMEYVDGQLWDRYCAGRKLTVEARIRLFLQVCEAVEYAHQNLIIHGDLKPANILVTGEGTVKLLDFGTAKLLHDPEGSVTRFAALTPRYASPEQIRGERVNTLSDLFSLGVILYESLTGAWPFGDPAKAAEAAAGLPHRGEAVPPAEAVTEAAAAERSAPYDRLRRQMEGDLATILLKMLDSEAGERYASVREAKDDLERFCQGLPVEAHPHTAWYTARRFAARHWLAVPASALAVVALASLTAFSLYQSAQARAQAVRAERISEFAKKTFLSASSFWYSPLHGKHDAIQFTDILDNACARLGEAMGSDPEAEADLRGTLGYTYALLGDPVKGEAELLKGIGLLPRIRGGAPKVAANLYLNLCNTRSYEGRYADALVACRQALPIVRAWDRGVLTSVLHDTAFMAVNAGEPLPEAEAMYREALGYPRAGLPQNPAILNSRIGMLRLRQGDLEGGERILNEAEPLLRGNGEPFIEIVPVLYARALLEHIRGRYREAVQWMREAIDLVERRQAGYMGPDDLALQLAGNEALAGERGSLERMRGVEARLAASSEAPVERIRQHLYEGIVEARFGSKATAEKHFQAAIAIQLREMGRQPDLSVEPYVRLMELLRETGRGPEAAAVARRGLAAAELAYGKYFAAHPFVTEMQDCLRWSPVNGTGGRIGQAIPAGRGW